LLTIQTAQVTCLQINHICCVTTMCMYGSPLDKSRLVLNDNDDESDGSQDIPLPDDYIPSPSDVVCARGKVPADNVHARILEAPAHNYQMIRLTSSH